MKFFKVTKGIICYIPLTAEIHLQTLAVSWLPCHQLFCEILHNYCVNYYLHYGETCEDDILFTNHLMRKWLRAGTL